MQTSGKPIIKMMNKIFYLIVLSILLCSCAKVPDACFTIDMKNAKREVVYGDDSKPPVTNYYFLVDDTIYFHSECSENIYGARWDMGDCPIGANMRITPDVSHAYCCAGFYTVTLIVTNGGKESKAMERIEIRYH